MADFIVDLDETETEAVVVARYELRKGGLAELFGQYGSSGPVAKADRPQLLAAIRPSIPRLFERTLQAVDPRDPDNTRALAWSSFEALFMTSFISAQRGLDDVTDRESDVLAVLLEQLFKAADRPSAAQDEQATAVALRKAVKSVETELDSEFRAQLGKLLPTLDQFGYPGLAGPALLTEVSLAVENLLKTSTKVRYAGHHGVALPESYNGLGTRNLISMLVQLVAFSRAFATRGADPGIHLVFIEEPEAHLHPQMQEVFIRQLNQLASALIGPDSGIGQWPVQFVVSTHSSHVANEAPFTAIRYFVASAESSDTNVRVTDVRDLSDESIVEADFLHRYLTLTRCDLFFADVAILVEGASERLLLPAMIELLESESPRPGLSSQYISLLEVGGAYAHLFFPLLDFLDLPALVITDLDSVDGASQGKACLVADGVKTSNATIRSWFDDKSISPATLIGVADEKKVKQRRRLAYQVPESPGDPCGRTFEDAFILGNRDLFKKELDLADLAGSARALANKETKSTFALKYAIKTKGWVVPRYIREGLMWIFCLRSQDHAVQSVPESAIAETAGKSAVTS